MKKISIFVDGGTAGAGPVGIAAVARTREGYFIGWLSKQLKRMTNNEAEYHAALLGLELAQQLSTPAVEIVTDSEVVVRQMQGISRVNSQRLKKLHQQLVQRMADFGSVTFRHVLRNENQLADALATEAIRGQTVAMPGQKNKPSFYFASWLAG